MHLNSQEHRRTHQDSQLDWAHPIQRNHRAHLLCEVGSILALILYLLLSFFGDFPQRSIPEFQLIAHACCNSLLCKKNKNERTAVVTLHGKFVLVIAIFFPPLNLRGVGILCQSDFLTGDTCEKLPLKADCV